jgi:hypothetical protein
MASVLIDQNSTATAEILSDIFRPSAGAVSSVFIVHSSDVDLTVDVQVDMGGSTGWVDYIVGESVTAGQAHAIVVDVPLPQRVAVTPASSSSTDVRVLAQSSGQK